MIRYLTIKQDVPDAPEAEAEAEVAEISFYTPMPKGDGILRS